MAVAAVGQVAHHQAQLGLGGDAVAGVQAQQHQRALLNGPGIGARAAVFIGLAGGSHIASQRPLRTRQLVVGRQAHAVARLLGAEALVLLRAGNILCAGVGVARCQIQLRAQLAVHAQIKPLADDLTSSGIAGTTAGIAGVVGHRGIEHRQIGLRQAEHGSRDIEALVQQLALDTHFVVGTHDRVEHIAILAAVGLGVEDVRIAGIGGVLRIDVVDQPGIGRDHALFLRRHHAGQGVLALVVADAGAGDQLERIGQAPARHAVDAHIAGFCLAGRCAQAIGDGAQAFGVKAVDIDRRGGRVAGARVLVAEAGAVHTHGQLMLASQEIKRPSGIDIDHIGLHDRCVVALATANEEAIASRRVQVAREAAEVLDVVVGLLPCVVGLQAPSAGQLLAEAHGVDVVVAHRAVVGIAPEGRARQAGIAAIGRQGHAKMAPARVLLQLHAGAQGGGGAQVGLDNAVARIAVTVDIVGKRFAVVRHGHQAAPDDTRIDQRAGHIAHHAPLLPGAQLHLALGLEGIGRALEHHVDRTARATCARHQTRRALQNFHPVDKGAIELGRAVAAVDARRRGHAIDLGLHAKAPAVVVGTNAAAIHCKHPADSAQRIIHRRHARIVHLLAGDDGECLRGFALAQVQLGAGAGMPCRIAARTFGAAAAVGCGRHRDGVQSHIRCRRGTGRCSRAGRRQLAQHIGGPALLDHLKTTATQQPGKALGLAIAALQAAAAQPRQGGLLKHQLHPGRCRVLRQHIRQRPGSDRIALGTRYRLRRQRPRCRQGQARRAATHKACTNSALQQSQSKALAMPRAAWRSGGHWSSSL